MKLAGCLAAGHDKQRQKNLPPPRKRGGDVGTESCEARSGLVGVPVVVEPVPVVVPATVVAVQVRHVQVAIRVSGTCSMPSAPPLFDAGRKSFEAGHLKVESCSGSHSPTRRTNPPTCCTKYRSPEGEYYKITLAQGVPGATPY